MLPAAFSVPLLENDLIGTEAPAGAPAFLGRAEGAGAACDPAIFLVDDPEPVLACGGHQSSALSLNGCGAQHQTHTAARDIAMRQQLPESSADDMLRELERSMDFLLPHQSIELLLMGGGGRGDDGRSSWQSPPISGPNTPPSALTSPTNWQPSAFPAIPEETELPQAELEPSLPDLTASAFSHPQPDAQQLSIFVPLTMLPDAAAAPEIKAEPFTSPKAGADAIGSNSGDEEAPSPTASDVSSLHGMDATFSNGGGRRYPRIASMPNLHLSLEEASSAGPPAAQRRRTSGRARALPRSRSHSDLSLAHGGNRTAVASDELERYNVPHLPFLTPPHLRKGRGGRQPAIDPRLDPSVDPKRARRIMANRLSAAKSKLRQKNSAQAEAQVAELERLQAEGLLPKPEPMDASPAAIAPSLSNTQRR
ncbi:hypothetical protein D9Q98_002088 [Chlorella vulgaris]|uniref:BZIP domain-containing protein n=1 Tax=Chlorella vulgaris TaxID=3077 RepID=A0A9D4TVP1_CHLVU|nr:hypothetical protein D9Q98_002088 [Chlorella vulgaris]